MSNVFQIGTDNYIFNVDDQDRITDLSFPRKGVDNILARSFIGIYLWRNGEPCELPAPQFEVGFSNSLPEFYAKYVLDEVDIIKEYHAHPRFIEVKFSIESKIDQRSSYLLFLTANPDFGSNGLRDCACFYPNINGIVHYENESYMGITANTQIYQYSCQSPKDFHGRGSKPDWNGELTKNDVTTGTTESTLKLSLELAPHQTRSISFYVLLGRSFAELEHIYKEVSQEPKSSSLDTKNAANEKVIRLADTLELSTIETNQLQNLYNMSRYLVRNSFCPNGGNFAAWDGSYYKKDGVDDYGYFWPRDGAWAIMASLSDDLLPAQTYHKYFQFLSQCLQGRDFLFHRYQLTETGSFGSSWHSWREKMPIQIDQTALNIIAYQKYCEKFAIEDRQIESLMIQLGEFLEKYSGQEYYDSWEHYWGRFLNSEVSIISAFQSLSMISSEQKWKDLAETHRKALKEFLIEGKYIRGFTKKRQDNRNDALIHWLWKLEILDIEDKVLTETVKQSAQALGLDLGGFARVEQDHYLNPDPQNITGTAWYISTLWFAQYYLLNQDFEKSAETLRFTLRHMDHTYLLPEMANPIHGTSMSVKPLIWSHVAVLELINIWS